MPRKSATINCIAPTQYSSGEGNYLTFYLADTEYGIRLHKVKEIIGMMRISPMPQTPKYCRGVMRVGGRVIPVIDLGVLFGREPADHTRAACVIVVEARRAARPLHIGIVAHALSRAVSFKSFEIEDAPSSVNSSAHGCIVGVARRGGNKKILLNADRLAGAASFGIMDQVA